MYTSYFSDLEIVKQRLNILSKNKKINAKIADDLIIIGQKKFKIILENIFESELKELISMENYNEFILYSYKSYYGEIPAQSTEKNQLYKRRLNLFQKGKRWADTTGDRFYSMLDEINELFEDTPINLYGELCSKYNKRYLKIAVGEDPHIDIESSFITLPDLSILRAIGNGSICAYFKNYIRLVLLCKSVS